MRMVVQPQRESPGGTIAELWLTTRKQPGKICRTRQFRADWRERLVVRGQKNFKRNQSIESEDARGTSLAWLTADGASWECRGSPWNFEGSCWDARHPKRKTDLGGVRVGRAGAVCAACRRDVPHQGPRQYRGRAAEPADRLRSRRRPQRHR